LHKRYERRYGNTSEKEARDISVVLDYNISECTTETDPHQPAREDDSDAQFVAVEADKEFPDKKNLREDRTEAYIKKEYLF
jgi:hypothetical protein